MKESVGVGFTIGLLVIALLVFDAIYYGFVFKILWGWFMTPFGLPQLSVAWAIGLFSVVGMLRSTTATKDESVSVSKELLVPAVALLIGFIAHHFM